LANSLAHSTLLVLACDRKPSYRNETPLYTAPQQLAKPEQWGDSAISDPVFLNAQRDINGAIRQLAKREWVGLTDDEVNLIYAEPQTHVGQYARAIEAKLKEKNNGSV
jgi:hypothetical protein